MQQVWHDDKSKVTMNATCAMFLTEMPKSALLRDYLPKPLSEHFHSQANMQAGRQTGRQVHRRVLKLRTDGLA